MTLQYDMASLSLLDRFTRAHLLNSLSGFKSASLIGTANAEGITNLAIFSNIVHLGADPALIGFVNRPLEAAPHTLGNIEKTGVYTINLITENMVDAAHQTSAKYPEGISEFEKVGFTPEWREGITAPFVAESPVKYALELKEIVPISYNRTFFVIGAITQVIVEKDLMEKDGFLALEQAGVVSSLGMDGYYGVKRLKRLPYAKPQ
jgi:flavin reductase (DIM6/NTAB) family NADH-FMN oxidoreductase RutF